MSESIPLTTERIVMASTRALRAVDDDHEEHLGKVQAFADGLPDKYLGCRTSRYHQMRPRQAGRYPDGGWRVIERCVLCHTKRTQELDRRGLVVRSSYEHPEGYLVEGLGRMDADGNGVLRIARIMRRGEIEELERG